MTVQRNQTRTAVVNVVSFLIVFTLCIVFAVKPLTPLHQGFFCDDVSIRYPYSEDTISASVLALTTIVPVLLMVVVTEILYGVFAGRLGKDTGHTWTQNAKGEIKKGLFRAGILVACVNYGNSLCFVLTEVFKLSFGRLRPYFLAVCQPETDVTSFANCSHWYIEDVTCLNTDDSELLNIRKSFLSGHASIAVFNMLFICLYLQRRLPRSTPRLLVSTLQGVALGYDVFVCGTRVCDNAHRLEDVLGGAMLGILCVLLTYFKVCPDTIRHPPLNESDSSPTNQKGTVHALTSIQTNE